MAPERIKKSTPAAGQRPLQEPPVPQQRTAKKKRKSGEETIPISSGDEALTQLVPQRKKAKAKAKAKEPVPLSSKSAESDSDLDETVIDNDEDGADDYDDDLSAEELEEIERTQLLHTLEGQDNITIDQAIVLEPCETFTHVQDSNELPEREKSPRRSATDRQEFILLHLTSLVHKGLFDKLSAFIQATIPPRKLTTPTTGPGRLSSILVPKQSQRAHWTLEDPRLAEIWDRMVDRLIKEAERSRYDFDPAMLVAPSGRLDAPILFGLHWPPWTEELPKYPTMLDMMYNPCIKLLAEKFGGLHEALSFDFRPLALRKPGNYYSRPPWHDMPSGMLRIIDETLKEIMEAATAKVAVYFGKHDYNMYMNLYPNSKPIKLSETPIYGRNFTHACIEYFESGANTGEIRRLVFFCYHPEAIMRGLHPVQATLMENICNLASDVVELPGVQRNLFRHYLKLLPGRPVKKSIYTKLEPGDKLDIVFRNIKFSTDYTIASRAYGVEIRDKRLYTHQTLPKRLLGLLDPDLEVHAWRRRLVLQGKDLLELDEATDQRIRTAIRARLADLRKDSPSLAMQAICKLLEEPDMHYYGIGQDHHKAAYNNKRQIARQAGPKPLEALKAATAVFKELGPRRIRAEPVFAHERGGTSQVTASLADLEHASLKVLAKQLNGANPRHVYDPDSRLGAIYLVSILPKANNTMPSFKGDKMGLQTPFGVEMRNLKNLWETRKRPVRYAGPVRRDAFMNYVIPKIKAHGLEDRVPDIWKDYL